MYTLRFLMLAAMLAIPAASQSLSSSPFPNPVGAGSLQPNWSVTPDGGVVLNWTEASKDGSYSLRYAVRRGSNVVRTGDHRRASSFLPPSGRGSGGHGDDRWPLARTLGGKSGIE